MIAADPARRSRCTPARDLDKVERLGGRLVTPEDDEWSAPAGVSAVRFGRFGDVPQVALCVRGNRELHEATERTLCGNNARSRTRSPTTRSASAHPTFTDEGLRMLASQTQETAAALDDPSRPPPSAPAAEPTGCSHRRHERPPPCLARPRFGVSSPTVNPVRDAN
ncbi:hypothetical protein D7D52_33160 [Nocardia yunnanensis]|uniref:Uncharacterized protein n=1 Tax=Nocardia yunnanensis TaxID=2382165 RepID=A0A386ZL41_9NOCA|nr:hypothetical protein D7D52_33160 [Nocardia yunnanensis]